MFRTTDRFHVSFSFSSSIFSSPVPPPLSVSPLSAIMHLYFTLSLPLAILPPSLSPTLTFTITYTHFPSLLSLHPLYISPLSLSLHSPRGSARASRELIYRINSRSILPVNHMDTQPENEPTNLIFPSLTLNALLDGHCATVPGCRRLCYRRQYIWSLEKIHACLKGATLDQWVIAHLYYRTR